MDLIDLLSGLFLASCFFVGIHGALLMNYLFISYYLVALFIVVFLHVKSRLQIYLLIWLLLFFYFSHFQFTIVFSNIVFNGIKNSLEG